MSPEERIEEIVKVIKQTDEVDKDWLLGVLTAPIFFNERLTKRLAAKLKAAREELKVSDETLDTFIEMDTEATLENIRLTAALRNLVSKLDEITEHKAFTSVFHIAQIHGAPYDGPTFTAELTHARELLEELDPDYSKEEENAQVPSDGNSNG